LSISYLGQWAAGLRTIVAAFGWALCAPVAEAQICGSDYTIKDGETLSDIAARVYGNPTQWTVIFYANQDRLGSNVSLLVPGLAVRLPCVGAALQPASPAAGAAPAGGTPLPQPPNDNAILVSSVVRRMEVLTADGYAPYTGRTLEGGGMLTQVVSAALDVVKTESKGKFDYGVSWVNDWAAHLNPLLTTRAFDIGFPWARPSCEDPASLTADGQLRCQKFYFSDPLYEVVTTVFVRNDSRITALKAETIAGTTLCRPTGYPTSVFDQNGRGWLKDGKIKLLRPSTVTECFRLLAAGTVDGVAMAELVGRAAASSEGLLEQVKEIDPPLSLDTLHVIVSKSHPNARTMLYYVNAGLAKVRETGAYDRIVERHLTKYLESQARPTPNPALAIVPAAPPKSDTSAKPDSARPAEPAASATAVAKNGLEPTAKK
jgi:polar amino acid transport system substrate-binding protein